MMMIHSSDVSLALSNADNALSRSAHRLVDHGKHRQRSQRNKIHPARTTATPCTSNKQVQFALEANQVIKPSLFVEDLLGEASCIWYNVKDYDRFLAELRHDARKKAKGVVSRVPYEKLLLEATYDACRNAVLPSLTLTQADEQKLVEWATCTPTRIGLERTVTREGYARRYGTMVNTVLSLQRGQASSEAIRAELEHHSRPHRLFARAIGQASDIAAARSA